LQYANCNYYNLEIAKWLWDISNHKINIYAGNERAFCLGCYYGHLEISEWLLNLDFDYFSNYIKENIIKSRPKIDKNTIVVI
jgi:hypothetical protein